MKLLGITKIKELAKLDELELDGYLFPLKDYSCDYPVTYTLEEIKKIREKNKDKLFFIIMNAMFFHKDLLSLTTTLKEIDQLGFDGILYYDDAVFMLMKKNSLKTPLFFFKTHMATNHDTLNFYHNLGVKGAFLSNEITLDEIKKIRKNTTCELMIMLAGYPISGMSRRHLLSNYAKMAKQERKNFLEVIEPVSNQNYFITEAKNGTSFHYGKRLNASRCYSALCDIGLDYGLLLQNDLSFDKYRELVTSFRKNNMERVDTLIGRNRGFFYRKSIYRVKK